MKSGYRKQLSRWGMIFLFFVVLSRLALANQEKMPLDRPSEAIVIALDGQSLCYRGEGRHHLSVHSKIYAGDEIIVGEKSVVWLLTLQGRFIRLYSHTSLSFLGQATRSKKSFLALRLAEGALYLSPTLSDLLKESSSSSSSLLETERIQFQDVPSQDWPKDLSLPVVDTVLVMPNVSLRADDLHGHFISETLGKSYWRIEDTSLKVERITIQKRGAKQFETAINPELKWWSMDSSGREIQEVVEKDRLSLLNQVTWPTLRFHSLIHWGMFMAKNYYMHFWQNLQKKENNTADFESFGQATMATFWQKSGAEESIQLSNAKKLNVEYTDKSQRFFKVELNDALFDRELGDYFRAINRSENK